MSTGAGRFFRNPERQPRVFGASAPSVSVNRYRSPWTVVSRQPVMGPGACGIVLDSTADSLVVGSAIAVLVAYSRATEAVAPEAAAGGTCVGALFFVAT